MQESLSAGWGETCFLNREMSKKFHAFPNINKSSERRPCVPCYSPPLFPIIARPLSALGMSLDHCNFTMPLHNITACIIPWHSAITNPAITKTPLERKTFESPVELHRGYYTVARRYEFYVRVARRTTYCSCHSNIKFISSRHRVISSTSHESLSACSKRVTE